MAFNVLSNGAWKAGTPKGVLVDGVWKPPSKVSVLSNGVWKQVWPVVFVADAPDDV